MIARENNNKKILSTIVNLEPPLHKAALEKNIKTKKFAFFICFLLSFLEKKKILRNAEPTPRKGEET